MKRCIFCIFAGTILTAGAQTPAPPARPPAPAAPTQAPAGAAARNQDVIYTKAGLEIAGTVTRSGADNLDVRFKSPTGALITQRVPLTNVDRIVFANSDKLEAELARYDAGSLPQVLLKWRSQLPMIDLSESPAGAYGLRAAQLLLESGNPASAKSAGEILKLITDKDWDPVRKDRARTLVIDSLRRAGKHDETLKAARELLAADAAAESKAEVSYYLALALSEDYSKFIKENPRWASDPYMKPKRDALYNDVLDSMLAPYLRYGAPPEVTAKSLMAATNFLEEFGGHDEARALAQDVVKIFAKQPEAAEAKKFLEKD